MKFIGGFLISIWLARYLEPEKLGIYSYALALFSITGSVASLGLNGIAVRELVTATKEKKRDVFSTILFLKTAGAVFMFLMLLIFISTTKISEDKYALSLIIGFGLFFTPFTTIGNFFDSSLSSKYSVIARNTSYIIKSILVICFIVFKWSLLILSFITLSESFLAAVFLILIYRKNGVGLNFKMDFSYAKVLLKQSWPLIISSLGAILYLKMDQVMVVEMVNDAEGGIYNVAVKYSSIFYFIQAVIMTSVFPSLVKSRKEKEEKYLYNVQKVSALFLYTGLSVIIGTYFFIDIFISLTFGEAYVKSISIIKIHILSLPLVYWGGVLSKWLIIEKLTKYSLLRHGLGLSVNLILNIILIPKYGGEGAAIASFFALIFSVLIVLFFNQRLFLLLKVFMKSLFIPFHYLEIYFRKNN